MKEWTDITADLPQNKEPGNIGPQGLGLQPSGTCVPSPVALGFQVIGMLLAGLYNMLGLTRWQKQAYRDRAYRVRGAIAAAVREMRPLFTMQCLRPNGRVRAVSGGNR